MKSIRNIALAAVAVILASCMGNYDDEPTMQLPPYGNNNINEENIISIGELKQMFDKQLSTDQRDGVSYAQVLNDIKIRGWVTANDIEGNIYNEIGLSDDTGAILVCISQGGLFGYLPVGTEIIIDLNVCYGPKRPLDALVSQRKAPDGRIKILRASLVYADERGNQHPALDDHAITPG